MVTAMPMLAVPLALTLQQIQRYRSVLPLMAAPLIGWGMACTFISFTDRLATYSATVLTSSTNGPAERLGGMFGIPLVRLLPNFDAPPTFGSFAKVALSIAVIAIFAALIDRSARGRPLGGVTTTTQSRVTVSSEHVAFNDDADHPRWHKQGLAGDWDADEGERGAGG